MSRSPSESPRFGSQPNPLPTRENPSPAQAATAAAAAAATATAGGPSSSGGIDPQLLANLVSASVSAALSALPAVVPTPAPAVPTANASGRFIKASDLPVFKGYSLDGADATSFLEKLETQFTLAGTTDSDKTHYASLAFPLDTPALAWFREQRELGLFRDLHDPPDVLRYTFFKQAFLQRFSTPIARRYALEDTWDRFTQKGTVSEHHIKFTKLWYKLQQLGIVIAPDVVASKFLRSLKPELFYAVCTKNRDLPDLETIHRQAVEAEYQFKPSSSRSAPQFGGLFPPPNPKNQDSEPPKDRNNEKKGDKYCTWHKWNKTHTTKDCRKIKDLKDKGEWKGTE